MKQLRRTALGGTLEDLFQIGGKLGTFLKKVSGGLALRDKDDATYAKLQASSVEVSGNDIVFNFGATGTGADRKLTLRRPASGMSADAVITLPGATGTMTMDGVIAGLTAEAAELNILDGATLSTAELNTLDGITASTAELNILDGVTATAAELNALDGITASTAELNILDGVTADATELNLVDGASAAGVVASKAVIAGSDKSIIGLLAHCVDKSANWNVAAADSGSTFFLTAADKVATLPAVAAGLRYKFIITAAALSTGTGFALAVQSGEKIMGSGITSAVDKKFINTGATDHEGDSVTVVGHANGWYIESTTGTWAREA